MFDHCPSPILRILIQYAYLQNPLAYPYNLNWIKIFQTVLYPCPFALTMIDTRCNTEKRKRKKRIKNKSIRSRMQRRKEGRGDIGGCFVQVTLKVAHTPVGNLNFGQFSSTSWPKVVRSPMHRNGLWEPISPGYGSHGTVAALFHPFSYYIHPCSRKGRKHAYRATVVYLSSFRPIARNPMKFQCAPPLASVLAGITPLDFRDYNKRREL